MAEKIEKVVASDELRSVATLVQGSGHTILEDRPEATYVLTRAGRVAAVCSHWWHGTPPFAGQRTGLIGHFFCSDAGSGRKIIEHALKALHEKGCQYLIGPMNGSTWRSYRLVIENEQWPPFFLEPQNPETYPQAFRSAGFAPIATYRSSVTEGFEFRDESTLRAEEHLRQIGVKFRQLREDEIGTELGRIYHLSLESFRQNFLYTPITEADFLSLYDPLRPLMRPELTCLAEHHGELVGFLFTLPDYAQEARNEKIDTLVAKTVARRPDTGLRGLGRVLILEANRMAGEHGFSHLIHALMHEKNPSFAFSRRYARPIRKYALFGRALP